MTPTDIALVQSSFAQVAPSAGTVASLFYGRLFDQHPEVRPLFRSDIAVQGGKLMAMLGVVVDGLDDLGALVPAVQDLARRHVRYGVEPVHYVAVGGALLWTLREGLGDAFTPEVESAWTTAYQTLASVMIEAGYPASAG